MTIWDLINQVDDPADLILYDSWGNQIEDPEILKKCVDTFARQLEEDFPHIKYRQSFQAIRIQARKVFKILKERGIIIPSDATITMELATHSKHDSRGGLIPGRQRYLRRISFSGNEISFSNLEDLKPIVEQPTYSSLINCPLPKRITRATEYKEIEKLKHEFNQEDTWWPTLNSAPPGYADANAWIPKIDLDFSREHNRGESEMHGEARIPIHEIGDQQSSIFFSAGWYWKSDPPTPDPAVPRRPIRGTDTWESRLGLNGLVLPTTWKIANLILVSDPQLNESIDTLKRVCREEVDTDYHQEAMRLLSAHARFGEVTFIPDGTEFGDYTGAFMERFTDDAQIQDNTKDQIQICHSYRLNECLDEHPEYDEYEDEIIAYWYTPKEWALRAVEKLVTNLIEMKATVRMHGWTGHEDQEGFGILPPPGSWAEKQLLQLANLSNAFEYGQADESKGSTDQNKMKQLWKAATKESLEVDRNYSAGDDYGPDYESDDKPWLIIDSIGDFQTIFADSPRVIRWKYCLVEP